jgi:hypothetical protein
MKIISLGDSNIVTKSFSLLDKVIRLCALDLQHTDTCIWISRPVNIAENVQILFLFSNFGQILRQKLLESRTN